MADAPARTRLNALWQQLVLQKEINITDNHVTGLEKFNIKHTVQVNFEDTTDNPLLFQPMDQQELNKYPVDSAEEDEDCRYPEYEKEDRIDEYISWICEVVERWACLGSLRPDLISRRGLVDFEYTRDLERLRFGPGVLITA